MDTTGFSQVGRYGTLSLLKRQSTTPNSNPNDLITSFGIDEATLTFGSTSTCGVRLYYTDVDPVHCQLTFEDGKAFLAVLGQAGVLVDGCWVYPHSSSSGGNRSTQGQQQQQAIVPLSNNSEFEIHQKRFRFTYPPKEVRRAILATPAPAQKRALRLSMIHSAQVFSPRPSKDPRENLRILQSPLKQGIFPPQTPHNGKTPTRTRAVSPLKYSSKSETLSDDSSDEEQEAEEEDNEDAEEEIVLVRTNHPRVVEEERDLVILEDVPLDVPLVNRSTQGSPSRAEHGSSGQEAQIAAPEPQVPRTPRRKSLGGTALHRAVLIRSAQRAVWRAEREKEEEEEREEEMEVLGAVVAPVEADMEEDEDEYEDQDVEMRSVSSEEEETDEEEDAEAIAQNAANKSLWRKSLERIIPWGFGNAADDDEEEKEEDENPEEQVVEHEEEEEQGEEEEDEEPAPLPVRPAETPVRRALGSFMTPQVHNPAKQNVSQPKLGIFPAAERSNAPMAPPGLPESSSAQVAAPAPGPGRYSLGGGEARRIIIQQPWRVRDLVVPPPVPAEGSPTRPTASSIHPSATPMRETVGAEPRPTPVVTAEERRAIQERRRSAVREFKEDNFWKDGAPGMSPSKGTARMSLGGAPGRSVSPVKQESRAATSGMDVAGPSMSAPRRPVFGSPTKGRALGFAIAEEGDSGMANAEEAKGEEDEELDTRSLLERMRETVEDMKRRRSIVASTPRLELAARGATDTIERSILTRAAPTPAGAPTSVALATPERSTGDAFSMGSVKKLDFSRINTPAMRAGSAKATSTPAIKDEEENIMMESNELVMEEEPFSLLHPSTLEATPSSSSRKPPLVGKKQPEQEDVEDVRAIPLPEVVVDEAVEDEEPQEEEIVQKPKEIKGKARGRPRLLRAPKAPVVTETVEDDETEEVQETSRPQAKPKTAAKPRSRSAKSPSPALIPESEPAPTLAPPITRRQRSKSKTPQPPPEEELVPPPTRSRCTRKGTAEREEPTPAPTKREKKAAPVESEPEEEEEKKAKTPAAKRDRKPRAAPVEAEHEEVVDGVPELAPAAAPVKRSRSRKAAVEPEPQDQDDDEFESYGTRPATTTKTNSIPVKAPLKGRKKAVAVKQEPAEDEATTRAGRSAQTTAAKTPAASKLAVPATAPSKIAKPRGKLKTPGSAPAATSRILAGSSTNTTSAEKENSRGAGSGSNGSDDADEAPIKIRVSRRTGAAAAATGDSGKTTKTAIPRSGPKTVPKTAAKGKVKVEETQANEEEVARGRTTRATRTRTKTG